MKKIILIFGCLMISSKLCFCNENPSKLVSEMKSYFIETLIYNYGDSPENELLFSFLSLYLEKKGEISLVLDKEKLTKINNELFHDNNYYTFYPRLLFVKSIDEFLNVNTGSKPIIVFERKKNITDITNFGVYLNYKFISNIVKDSDNDALNNIYKYYNSTGIISYFNVAKSFIECRECLNDDHGKDFLTIVFWKYLCDLASLGFYKIGE